jgi:protein SCO1/2
MTRARRVIERSWLTATLVAAMLALVACSRSEPHEKFQAADVTGAAWGRDFHLLDGAGQPRSLADYRGKVVMLFFGYTNCPDACPTTLAKMAQAVDRLGTDAQRVQGLFVTVDPERDTRPVLTQYVRAFHPSFVGLSADKATTAATAKEFKVFYEAQQADDRGYYTVDHSSGIFVFDGHGRLRVFMGANVWVDAMVHDLKLLLSEPSSSDPS